MGKLLKKMTRKFAERLEPGETVTHHDLREYCHQRHKNMATNPTACSRQMNLCPSLEKLPKKENRINVYRKRDEKR